MPQSLTWYDTEIEHLLARDICDALNDLEALIFFSGQSSPPPLNAKHYSRWLNEQLSRKDFKSNIDCIIAAHEHLLHRLNVIEQHSPLSSSGVGNEKR